jgi:hypothetical protein
MVAGKMPVEQMLLQLIGVGGLGLAGAYMAVLSFAGVEPPLTPVYRIPLRVHIGQSTLPKAELTQVFDEINRIWWSQAGICFEVVAVAGDVLGADAFKVDLRRPSGFDLWFVPTIPGTPAVNGIYRGDHNVWSKDHPRLSPSTDPVEKPAARTAAHELGHGLQLVHYDGRADSESSLMSSGRLGWHLHSDEVRLARGSARQKALPDTTPIECGRPTFE